MRRLQPGIATAVLLFTSMACVGDPPGGSGAGGLQGPDRPLAWTAAEVYAVGGFDAPDWATFGEVSDVAFDGEGRLYLLDRQTAQVTMVSPEGAFLRTVGGQGDGPGEVGGPMGMTVLPDGRVVIPDLGKRALVVYGPEGEWRHNISLDLEVEGLPMGEVVAAGSGGLVAAQALRIRPSPEGNGSEAGPPPEPEHRPVWWYPVAKGDTARLLHRAWDPPPPPEGGESTLEAGSGGNGVVLRMNRIQAFEPQLHVAALPDGGVAVVDSSDYSVTLVSKEGTLMDRLRRPIPPTPVSDRIRELERDRRLAEIAERQGAIRLVGGGGGFRVSSEAMRRTLEDQVANMAFYPEIPVVEALAVDPWGRIWVQRSSGTPGENGPTDILTVAGGYLGTLPPDGVRIPDAFGPDGLAAYIELDELDVATVRVVRLPGDGGP